MNHVLCKNPISRGREQPPAGSQSPTASPTMTTMTTMPNQRNSATSAGLFRCSVSATALVASAVALAGDGEFIAIPGLGKYPAANPNGCYVNATNGYSMIRLSADGQVVTTVGYEPGFTDGAVDRFAVRWTEAGGLEQITGSLLSVGTQYGVVGISSDGSTIWGENWRWTEKGGYRSLSSILPGDFHVFGCSADGNTITGCRGTYGTGPLDFFRWTVGDAAPEILPRSVQNPEGYFYFNTISGDGSTVGGLARGPDYTSSAVVINLNGVINLTPTQDQSNIVWDFSSDGSVAVGMEFAPPSSVRAFRWTAAGGMEAVGPGDSSCLACNADGTIVGGSRFIFGVPGLIAWIRIGDAPWTDLEQYLISEQGLGAELDGWKLESVQDISADGRTIVGNGINPEGCEQGFLVRISLPGTNDIADLNGDGRVDAQDLAILLGAWGLSGGPADMNRDGLVNAADLAILLGRWNS